MDGAVGRLLVFDSGIGGLGVVRALRNTLPHARIDYLADTALFPYGEQPDAPLTARIVDLIDAACRARAYDLVVIACNTASTIALPALRARLGVPFVGCVPPIRWAGRVSKTRTIGLLATSATARRPYVAELHARFAPDCRLVLHGARHLADLAERAFIGELVSDALIARELDALLGQPGGDAIDAIGLGCTHYSVLLPQFERLSAERDRTFLWLDPAPAVARHAAAILSAIGPFACRDQAPERVTLTAPPPRSREFSLALRALGYVGNDCLETVAA